jgi:hypothetical protein
MVYLLVGVSVIIVLGVIVLFLMIDVDSQSTQTIPRRACPLCGTDLGQEGRLFADELTRSNAPNELKIKGCTYCYDRDN